MQALIDRARTTAARSGDISHRAVGQSPQALFATCSDSRVVPALITGAEPGDLFELRTAGGIIPAYNTRNSSGEVATIEYAVEVLNIQDIVLCSHSHCGAVGALLRSDELKGMPAMRRLLQGEAPPTRLMPSSAQDDIIPAVQQHVLNQVDRLRNYPCIANRMERNALRLHAWCYEVHTGQVTAHDPAANTFLPL